VELELRDACRNFVQNYDSKAVRLRHFDFSVITNSPINAAVVEMMLYVLSIKKISGRIVNAFFASSHHANVRRRSCPLRL